MKAKTDADHIDAVLRAECPRLGKALNSIVTDDEDGIGFIVFAFGQGVTSCVGNTDDRAEIARRIKVVLDKWARESDASPLAREVH